MIMKHTIPCLAFFILPTIADIGDIGDIGGTPDYSAFLLASNQELPDDSTSNAFLLSSDGQLPDDSTNLFMEPLDSSLLPATNEPIASAQPDCISSNGNTDNLFLSRLRPRIDACLPPLPPVPNIYDSNSILNQLASPITIPTIPDTEKSDAQKLEEMLGLPDFTPGTKPAEQDDICPNELVGASQMPVCSSGRTGRDHLRRPGEDWFTLYNVRHWFPLDPCVNPERLWCCVRVDFSHHPLDPPEAPDVLTGYICKSPEDEALARAFFPPELDPWVIDPSQDPGHPLEEPPSKSNRL